MKYIKNLNKVLYILLPMLVTLSGIVIVFKLEQPKKADSPIFVHSSEIVNDAKFLQL